MIQILRMTAAGTAVLLAGAGLAGCGSGGSSTASVFPTCLTPKEPVALAIGARSNSPEPSLSANVTATMNSALGAHQAITIVRLDGSPQVVFSQAFNPQGANSQMAKADMNTYVSNLNQILAGTQQTATDVRAQAPQADVLDALAVAASEVPRGGNVIVMDSGLQTTAPLNFTTGLLNDDPQTIVDYLKSAGELPDLRGRHVYFSGLGWTASPQPTLDVNNRNKVVAIWARLAMAAGASCVNAAPNADTEEAVPGRPPVAIVTPPPSAPPPGACSTTDLGDANNVGFDFDSTTYRDPGGAHATLQKLANVMLRTGESLTLTGATSSEGTGQYNLQLSLERATAVKSTLVGMGIDGSRITTHGDGSQLPGRLNDRGPNGQLLIGPAIQNRKVVAKLTGAGCPSA
jgi:OOP family OmpA-OmpF porin